MYHRVVCCVLSNNVSCRGKKKVLLFGEVRIVHGGSHRSHVASRVPLTRIGAHMCTRTCTACSFEFLASAVRSRCVMEASTHSSHPISLPSSTCKKFGIRVK
jgi:hypothetical protein